MRSPTLSYLCLSLLYFGAVATHLLHLVEDSHGHPASTMVAPSVCVSPNCSLSVFPGCGVYRNTFRTCSLFLFSDLGCVKPWGLVVGRELDGENLAKREEQAKVSLSLHHSSHSHSCSFFSATHFPPQVQRLLL